MDKFYYVLSDPSPVTVAMMALLIGVGCMALWAR